MKNLTTGLEALLERLIEKNRNIHDRLMRDGDDECRRANKGAEKAWGLAIELGDIKIARRAEQRLDEAEYRADRAAALAHDCIQVAWAAESALYSLRST